MVTKEVKGMECFQTDMQIMTDLLKEHSVREQTKISSVGTGNLSEAIPIWETNYVIESTPQAPPIHGHLTCVCFLLGVVYALLEMQVKIKQLAWKQLFWSFYPSDPGILSNIRELSKSVDGPS
jgi:hypothetical protein